jgi:hypothetical protein
MGQNVFVTVVMGSRIVSIFPHFGQPAHAERTCLTRTRRLVRAATKSAANPS